MICIMHTATADFKCAVCISFDLWMPRKAEDLLAIATHYIDPKTYKVCHNSIAGLVKSTSTDGSSLAGDL